MRVVLVSGFLGSGKTTVIRELARFLVERRGVRVVILENEVGEVGIDDLFLEREGFQVKGIFGGCICCQLTGEVTKAVNGIGREFSPDFTIIEATGVARPGAILEVMKKYGEGIGGMGVIDLVDAERWEMLCEITPELVLGQIRESGMVLVNKVEEMEEGEVRDIVARVSELNAAAVVHALSAQAGLSEDLLGEMASLREEDS